MNTKNVFIVIFSVAILTTLTTTVGFFSGIDYQKIVTPMTGMKLMSMSVITSALT